MLKAENVRCLRVERRLLSALSFAALRGKLLAVMCENGRSQPVKPGTKQVFVVIDREISWRR